MVNCVKLSLIHIENRKIITQKMLPPFFNSLNSFLIMLVTQYRLLHRRLLSPPDIFHHQFFFLFVESKFV